MGSGQRIAFIHGRPKRAFERSRCVWKDIPRTANAIAGFGVAGVARAVDRKVLRSHMLHGQAQPRHQA